MTGQGMTEVQGMPYTAAFIRGIQQAVETVNQWIVAAAKAINTISRVFNISALTWPQESRVESARRRRVDRMMRTRDRRKARRDRRAAP